MNNGAALDQVISSLDLHLVISDRNVLGYLAQFPDEESQIEKALEALKVGVIAIQSASPTLDTTVVQERFAEMEAGMRESVSDFQRRFKQNLSDYFEENKGIVPRSIDGIFGSSGSLNRTFESFFDPEKGQLCRLMLGHIGPNSEFGRTIDPQNKQGLLAVLESRVQQLVEAKLDEVLKEFSLDEDKSAMSRLHALLAESFDKINRAVGHSDGREEEARKGHLKGIRFEDELYNDFFAPLCTQMEDEPALVARTPGANEGCKTGDLLSTLGESTGAPGVNIVVEAKDREVKLKDARSELQEAKTNRKAAIGIYVWSRGTEPTEVGNFRRIGDDFYVTVDRDDLRAGRPLLYFDAAYRIARAMAVAAVRKEAAEEVDLVEIENHVEALGTWSDRIADMATKARTIKNSGRLIEDTATELKEDLDGRIMAILKMLRH